MSTEVGVSVMRESDRQTDSKSSGAFLGVDRDLRVLYVEDNDDDFTLVRDIFTEHDITAHRLRSMKEMYAYARSPGVKFDLVLMDLGLPDVRGVEAVRVARDLFCDIPMIILSGAYYDDIADEAVRLGVESYMVKGQFHKEALINGVKIALMKERKKKISTKRTVRTLGELERRLDEL